MAIIEDEVDLDRLAERFAGWLRCQPGRSESRVTSINQASRANGFSNETYRLAVSLSGGANEEELILRLPPSRTGLFPDYDMRRQFTFMRQLQEEPGLHIARCHWLELDSGPLGRPFFVTESVAGMVPADNPPYVREGWLVEASAPQRSRLWNETLDQLVQLSCVRWEGGNLSRVDWPDRQRPRMQQHLDHWAGLADWGRSGLPDCDDSFLSDLHRWLQQHLPRQEWTGVVWGDSRFGNIIYRDFSPAALLDWELAVIGDPMIDLAYLLFHVFLYELYHGEPQTRAHRLSGFGSDESTVAAYCERTGRSSADYRYYWLFNAFKMLCIWQCKASLMLRTGNWTVEHAMEARQGSALRPHIAAVLESGPDGAYLR